MDDGLKLEIDGDLAGKLRIAADAEGVAVADYARVLLREELDDDWAEDDARFAEYKRTGVSIPAEEWIASLRESLKRRFATHK